MAKATRIPMIRTGQALNSLRDSGYDLPAALGEPIDNSLEAQANNVSVRLDEGKNKRGKSQIHRIIVADDGCGMDVDTLWYYLQLGFSTRYMSTQTIGKYGVGAKLAALNFGKRIDVWSRTDGKAHWLHVYFDLEAAMEGEEDGEETGIDAPTEQPIPEDLAEMFPEGSGTVVVWSQVDRLEEGRRARDANELRVEVEKELSRIFRFFINDGIVIRINGKELMPHDPLMLMENTWADQVLHESLKKSAGYSSKDGHFPATLIWEEEIKVAGSLANIRITRYPKEIVRKRYMGGDELAQKLRVPENEGQISFVRLNREVSYTNVPKIFPRGVSDPDRFIGIEVGFTPSLDEYFGIRNVKRGVEPHGELRNRIRMILQKHLTTARKQIDEIWGKASREDADTKGEHAGIVGAVKEADRTMPKGRAKGPSDEKEKQRILDDLAKDVVGSGDEKKKEREEYLQKLKELPFVVESVDFPGTNFIDIQHVNGHVLIRINTRHRFYREMWEPVREISMRDPGSVSGADAVKAARRTIEALTLLLIAYGKAESMHENPQDQYGELRSFWGQFLSSLMGKVKDVI